ncbi:hypothetical protein ACVXZY_03125 [Staphylococcus aureus]
MIRRTGLLANALNRAAEEEYHVPVKRQLADMAHMDNIKRYQI